MPGTLGMRGSLHPAESGPYLYDSRYLQREPDCHRSGRIAFETQDELYFSEYSTPPVSPVANFAAPTTGNSPLSVQFTDQSTGSITSYAWTFGDSGYLHSAEPCAYLQFSRILQREPGRG